MFGIFLTYLKQRVDKNFLYNSSHVEKPSMENCMTHSRLVVFAHGSRDPRWRAPFETFVATLTADLGADKVRLAYMEFVTPTLADMAEEAVRDGVQQLKILPLFMAGGAHVDRDIPEQVTAVQKRFPSLNLSVLPPIGEHPRLVALMQEIAREYVA
jgi:sirohydrochlorin cobaltochelatase